MTARVAPGCVQRPDPSQTLLVASVSWQPLLTRGLSFSTCLVTGGLSGRQVAGRMVRSRHEAWGMGCWHPCPPTPARVAAAKPHPPGLLTGAGTAPSGLPACGWAVRGPSWTCQRLWARLGCSVYGAEAPSCLGEGLVSLGLAGRA